jgi:hypothetical protein
MFVMTRSNGIEAGYMAYFPADRLLNTFRTEAGLPAGSANPASGWEQPEDGQLSSELRGHFLGHFHFATAQLVSGDQEAKAKCDYIARNSPNARTLRCRRGLGELC